MLTVAGVPIVERMFRQFVEAGFRQFTVVTGWLGDVIVDHFRNLERPADVLVDFLHEAIPRGNAAALGQVAEHDVTVIFAFADLVTDLDLVQFLDFHIDRGADLTLASHWLAHRLQFGELTVEGDRVVNYKEKPERRFLICSGIIAAEPPILALTGRAIGSVGLSDVVTASINAGYDVGHWPHQATWFDINSAETLMDVERDLSAASRRLIQ
jgi:NDP-mannose synthase